MEEGNGGDGGYLLVKESAPEVRTHHLHIVPAGGWQWRAYIVFRDALRESERLCEDYARLKADLQARFPGEREKYTAEKADFIRSALKARGETCC